MRNTLRAALTCAAMTWAVLTAPVARAADDLAQIRAELGQLRAAYEARIRALEQRLQDTEQRLTAATAGAGAAVAANSAASVAGARLADARPARNGPVPAAGFNPEIGLVLAGNWNRLSRDPADFGVRGFIPNGGEIGPGMRGFNLGESELSLTANIDPLFAGRLIAALGADNTASVEEAAVRSGALGQGLTVTFGRMLSGIGYLNSQHAHAWDFADAPLVYQAMFGSQYRNDGVQLKWLAPTERFVEFGLEFGSGAEFPASASNRNGAGTVSLFGHVGDDLGDSASWRAGLSLQSARARERSWTDLDAAGVNVTNAFTGKSRTWIADAVYKWAPGGNSTQRNFKLQGEYFHRTESGDLTYDTQAASLGTATDRYRSAQSGWYLQGIYQFIANWRVGLRHDRLDAGRVAIGLVDNGTLTRADFPALEGYRPSRTSLMLDWSPSEFSRVRLQLARDRARPGGGDNQLFLQYIMSLGAHGAHTF